jgi:class 3 adenylate cyclase
VTLGTRGDERRVVTVVFADLVGFTTLSEAMDPEQVKNLVDRCFERLVADITAFGGRVDKIVGDAIVALFGAPVAHEDDAERAVRAALQMQANVVALSGELESVRMRIGVNTGEVLVGALRAGGDYTAMGDVVNVASRLQTMADPGQVLVGSPTRASTAAVVRYEPAGMLQTRGRDGTVEAWIAVECLAPPGRRPARVDGPLVGRREELGLLQHAVGAAVARHRAQLVVLLGDAGVGKSRLARELADWAVQEHDATVLEGRCVPYGEANVWWPMAEMMRQACAIEPCDSADDTLAKCRAAVATVTGVDVAGNEAERLATALSFLMGNQGALANVDPSRTRDEVRLSLLTFLEGLARRRPLVLALSELHWADELVFDAIDDLLDRLHHLPLVLMATARPEIQPRWAPRPGRHSEVVLHVDPLALVEGRQLLASISGNELEPGLQDAATPCSWRSCRLCWATPVAASRMCSPKPARRGQSSQRPSEAWWQPDSTCSVATSAPWWRTRRWWACGVVSTPSPPWRRHGARRRSVRSSRSWRPRTCSPCRATRGPSGPDWRARSPTRS